MPTVKKRQRYAGKEEEEKGTRKTWMKKEYEWGSKGYYKGYGREEEMKVERVESVT